MMVVFFAAFLFAGNINAEDKNPIKIGFVGGLTGRNSDLGIQGRNGATLAVEDINRHGGINGKPVQLITRDDKQDPQTALKVDRELIEEDVVAIIGHMTSTMSEAALPLINERKITMISPTSGTNKLTGIDDYFLRVVNPDIQLINLKTDYAFRNLRLRRMAIVYDLSNRTYTENYAANFKSAFERLGGKVVFSDSFMTGPDVGFKGFARKILPAKPDGLLIVAGAMDTAILCQHIRMTGSKIPILVSGWAQTPDLLRHGGPAVEGVVAAQYFDHGSLAKPFVMLREKYRARFGDVDLTFAVVTGYEAVMVVKDALSRNPDPKRLKETILKQKNFNGMQGVFEIDSYGDAKRKGYIATVQNNRFCGRK